MRSFRGQRALFLFMVSGGLALAVLAGCGEKLDKASPQDVVKRIESASDDGLREIIQTLAARGDAGIPDMLQAFAGSSKSTTQMVLAESVFRMKASPKRTEALKRMGETAKDPNVRETIARFVAQAR